MICLPDERGGEDVVGPKPYPEEFREDVARVVRASALCDAHRDDPEFGYRYLLDEARDAGQATVERTVWRICPHNGWWSVVGTDAAATTSGRAAGA